MPLYTYVIGYKGSSYVVQGSHSNFTGFSMTWAANIPESALPALTPVLRKELVRKAYAGSFVEVPQAKHVWRKTVQVGSSEFVVHAIQTER